MKILKIAAKDLPLFNGICEIDFLPQQRVNSENAENMSELFSTPSNTFYKNNVISFTGINASGKTSVLKLITFVFGMLNNTPINSITCSEVLDGIADNNTVSISEKSYKAFFALILDISFDFNVSDTIFNLLFSFAITVLWSPSKKKQRIY